MILMNIVIESHLSADGFDVIIEDEGNERCLYSESYYYGSNASYKRENAEERKPFTSDILSDLVKTHSVEEIVVIPGHYQFSGKAMGQTEVDAFTKEYITPVTELSNLIKVR